MHNQSINQSIKAAINLPKRSDNTYTFPQAVSYASQHIFLTFRIVLLVSVFIHLSIQCQHYNIVREQRTVDHCTIYAVIGTRTRALQTCSPVSSPLSSTSRSLFAVDVIYSNMIVQEKMKVKSWHPSYRPFCRG